MRLLHLLRLNYIGTYIVCTVGGNPGVTATARTYVPRSSIVTGENASEGDFVTVIMKKCRIPMVGVRSFGFSLFCRKKP